MSDIFSIQNIRFYNAGTIVNPAFGIEITYKDNDYKVKSMKIEGLPAEDLEAGIIELIEEAIERIDEEVEHD